NPCLNSFTVGLFCIISDSSAYLNASNRWLLASTGLAITLPSLSSLYLYVYNSLIVSVHDSSTTILWPCNHLMPCSILPGPFLAGKALIPFRFKSCTLLG